MSLFEQMLIGLIAGLMVALGGAIKDAPVEGFRWKTFIRSPIVASIVGTFISGVAPEVALFTVVGFERVIVELYKLITAKVPSKFVNGEWGKPA